MPDPSESTLGRVLLLISKWNGTIKVWLNSPQVHRITRPSESPRTRRRKWRTLINGLRETVSFCVLSPAAVYCRDWTVTPTDQTQSSWMLFSTNFRAQLPEAQANQEHLTWLMFQWNVFKIPVNYEFCRMPFFKKNKHDFQSVRLSEVMFIHVK